MKNLERRAIKLYSFVAVLLMALFIAGCSPSTNLNEPPEVLYGQDVCEECGMIINEERFAASYVTESEIVRRFDDVGGMLLYDQKHQEAVALFWVHDLDTEDWIDAKAAFFVLDEGLITPMGWGLAPFATQEQAENYIADNGGILTNFSTLQQEIADGNIDPTTLSSHDHDHEDGMEMEEEMEDEHSNMDMEDAGG